MKQKLTILIVCLSANIAYGHFQTDLHSHSEEKIAQELINCFDCRDAEERASKLSKDSIHFFINAVRSEEHKHVALRSMYFTASKYRQYEAQFSEEVKKEIVESTLERIRADMDFFMDFSSTHKALVAFNHPLVLEFAKANVDSENLRIKDGCERIIRNYIAGDTQSATTTAAEEAIEEATAPELGIEDSAEVLVAELIEEDVEQSSNWWLWLIGAVIVLGGAGLAIRRKS